MSVTLRFFASLRMTFSAAYAGENEGSLTKRVLTSSFCWNFYRILIVHSEEAIRLSKTILVIVSEQVTRVAGRAFELT